MAVVFISPKQRQRTFFVGITIVFLLFVTLISLGILFAQPKAVSPLIVFNKAKVSLDMSILDTDQFKNLQPFSQMEPQYSYKATTKANQPKKGFITAASPDQARTILESMGLAVSDIQLVQPGRDNPFIPYY